ncbi:primosomal protein [Pengzhenrongella frigida]|uniref:Primosomal protein n=1 Tax=Pengzhenrongella frigida TaxID=1259133 RepID=A0A4Q5N6P9_9MICO|nr:primosomal protein [Cellulomonas sp. HLT2-17]RYV52667.1 primosomal protein [Cellulomonas sp. HLT2-17]
MTVDPRAALDRLVAALEAHFHAISSRRSEDDPAVDDAYDVLADAFEVYDDALSGVYGESTPFDLADDDEEDDEDDVADLDDEDRVPDEAFVDDYDVLSDDAVGDRSEGARAQQ